MPFQNLETNVFGLTDTQVRASLPYLSLPRDLAAADLEPHGFAYYTEAAPPEPAWDERAVEAAPIDGVQQWVLEPNGRTLDALKTERLAAVAALRWQATQTFVYDGVLTQADPAMAVVNATLALRARRGVPAEAQQNWKLSDGVFRSWDEDAIEAFGFAIGDHIQACFDREEALTAAIQAAEDGAAVLAIDIAAGWPT